MGSNVQRNKIRVKKSSIQAVIEDWPGRIGYYKNGFSVSGAADHLAHRIANILVGNPPTEATIEIAGGLFELEFMGPSVIAITGGDLKPTLNGNPLRMWRSIKVEKGDVLKFDIPQGRGFRAYVAFAGGIDVPEFLGSKSTCTWGAYGGYKGRSLRAGDELEIRSPDNQLLKNLEGRKVKESLIPLFGHRWEVRMVTGPTTAPDYVTDSAMDLVFTHEFRTDRNSDRSAYRLVTPKEIFPKGWARSNGGVAGLHPSNIVDMGYPHPGGLNVTGDLITILGPDGPCGGGFVIIGTVIYADVWKVFQAIPGKDVIKFNHITIDEAEEERVKQEEMVSESNLLE